jgi:hypothetical protein
MTNKICRALSKTLKENCLTANSIKDISFSLSYRVNYFSRLSYVTMQKKKRGFC